MESDSLSSRESAGNRDGAIPQTSLFADFASFVVSRRTRGKPSGEAGFITLFVLLISIAAFLALGGLVQANYALHELNRRQAAELQARADDLRCRVP